MDSPPGFVELDRCFGVLDGTAPAEETAEQSYLLGSTHGLGELHWPALLANRLVVILGEPGSGKSWELRNLAASLNQQGQETFYVELEQLVSHPLEEVLRAEDRIRFQQWLRSNRSGRFLLDSVDESKLRLAADFHKALDSIRNAIGTAALDRASFVVSSRISEWQPVTDRSEVVVRLAPQPIPQAHRGHDASKVEVPILIVEIEPLSREQICKFVSAKELADADRFVAAIDEHHAWEFARRPADVNSLVEFWQVHGRLGTLTEIIEHDVTLKLRETVQRQKNFSLSEADARFGAETLAAATLFCKKIQFKVPDDSLINSSALDAARCLPSDWTPNQCAALLSRPLFDSATYGTIRFHHRRIAEYLAAAWLRRCMAEGAPNPVLLQLLFDEARGTKTARKGLIPVTAWLCAGNDSWNHEVRSCVLASSPELHLEYSDAEALPVEYRRAILRALVDRNEGKSKVWLDSSPDALRRLATPELAADISELLQNHETSTDIRAQLIMLVRFGQLTECVPALLDILSIAESDDELQVYALAALRDMGTDKSLREAWRILSSREALSDEIAGVAREAFYPRVIGPKDLAALFSRLEAKLHRSTHLSWTIERHFQVYMPPDQSGEVLFELNKLARVSPHMAIDGKETRVSEVYSWVLNVIPTVLLRLLELDTLTKEDCNVAAETLALLSESRNFLDRHNEDIEEVDAATYRHAEVRRTFFRQSVARWRSDGATERPSTWLFFDRSGVVSLHKSDGEWLLKEIAQPSDPRDRELCLGIALRLGAARTSSGQRLLYQAVGSNAEFSQLIRRAAFEERWSWVLRKWSQWTDRYFWKDWQSKKKSQLTRLFIAWKSWWIPLRNLRLLRSGQALNLLGRLLREAAGAGTKRARTDWAALAVKRGRLVANAVKEGCKRCFRNLAAPLLPHERPDPTQVECGLIVGLTGIQTLIDDQEVEFQSISDDEVRLATRYAVNKINGFPSWFPELGKIRPGTVGEVLKECVRGEWAYTPKRAHAYDVVADLAQEGGPLAGLVRDTVIELFRKGNPANLEILEFALEVLLKTSALPAPEIAALAADRCRTEPSVAAEPFVLWACVCLQFNADEGVKIIEERLNASDAAAEVVLRICNTLSGEVRHRLPVLPQADYLRPAVLREFVPLVFQFVRPVDDIDRGHDGPYTPTARDHASRFRDGLLVRLSQSDASDAAEALRELRDRTELAQHRDWISHLLDDRVRNDADAIPWSPTDLRDFAAGCRTGSYSGYGHMSTKPHPDMLIITVNEHETRAVIDAFKVAIGHEAVVVMRDARIYHDLGVLNGTRVFHAISEMGSGAVGGMQQTVDRAIRALDPGAVIAIGIAFGINENKQAIGDILLSKQLRLYDLQRIGKDEIVLRGSRPDAPARLVNYFQTFGQIKWKGASARFGLMLTGEKLVDNIDYRTQLLSFESEAIGGEMEGAGLYVSGTDHKVDWIVLKAICDFADGNKGQNKEKQQILAANSAATFLVEALKYAPLKRDDLVTIL